MKKILLIYSGGLDSTVLLHYLLKEKKYDVHALSFEYGQKHNKESLFAQKNCSILKIPHQIIELPLGAIFKSTLLQTGSDIPEGHYEAENMKQTVVPMRNTIFASVAAGYAISHDIHAIALAAHAGDHTIYPDCRPQFYQALNTVFALADWNPVEIQTPFVEKDKGEIVGIGLELGVDFALTWTCYKGQKTPCLKCGSCTERLEAFEKNGVKDPLTYI